QADRLIGGSAAFAGKVEIHDMVVENDVMKMREIEGGLEIPAGGEVTLERGGLHVMFMQLQEPMKEGETRTVTLEFENAGAVEFDVPVKRVEGGGHHEHGHGHGHAHD
ncbi:MAG: copper chaperone PCu(A)C, partial [Pseudomonadota bacterium]